MYKSISITEKGYVNYNIFRKRKSYHISFGLQGDIVGTLEIFSHTDGRKRTKSFVISRERLSEIVEPIYSYLCEKKPRHMLPLMGANDSIIDVILQAVKSDLKKNSMRSPLRLRDVFGRNIYVSLSTDEASIALYIEDKVSLSGQDVTLRIGVSGIKTTLYMDFKLRRPKEIIDKVFKILESRSTTTRDLREFAKYIVQKYYDGTLRVSPRDVEFSFRGLKNLVKEEWTELKELVNRRYYAKNAYKLYMTVFDRMLKRGVPLCLYRTSEGICFLPEIIDYIDNPL